MVKGRKGHPTERVAGNEKAFRGGTGNSQQTRLPLVVVRMAFKFSLMCENFFCFISWLREVTSKLCFSSALWNNLELTATELVWKKKLTWGLVFKVMIQIEKDLTLFVCNWFWSAPRLIFLPIRNAIGNNNKYNIYSNLISYQFQQEVHNLEGKCHSRILSGCLHSESGVPQQGAQPISSLSRGEVCLWNKAEVEENPHRATSSASVHRATFPRPGEL